MSNTWWNVPPEYQDRRVVIVDRDMSRFFDVPNTSYFSGSMEAPPMTICASSRCWLTVGSYCNRLLDPSNSNDSDQTNGLYVSRRVEGIL